MLMRGLVGIGAILCTAVPSVGQVGAVPPDTVITLERTSCFGSCPVYTVAIDANGQVTYEGHANVRVEGRQVDRVPPSRVAALLATVARIGFFGLSDRYWKDVTDLPTTFVTVTRQGRTKRIEDYLGAPDGLHELERQIDETARTRRWISLDAPMLDQMIAEGHKPAPVEAAGFLLQAVIHDDLVLMRALIDYGANPNGQAGNGTAPLFHVRSAAAVRLLVEAGADPNVGEPVGSSPLAWSTQLAGEVTQALIDAGAVVDKRTSAEGFTALWQASCEGNAEAVRILLAAGADPTVRVNNKSAIECARESKIAYGYVADALSLFPPLFQRNFDGVVIFLEQAIATRPTR